MTKDSLLLTLELLSQVRISVMDSNADEIWARLKSAREEVREELEGNGRVEGRENG